jgi:hypothetical protein
MKKASQRKLVKRKGKKFFFIKLCVLTKDDEHVGDMINLCGDLLKAGMPRIRGLILEDNKDRFIWDHNDISQLEKDS